MGLATNQLISNVVLAMNSIVSNGEELLPTLETSLPSLQCVSYLHMRDNEFNSMAPEIVNALSEMPNLEFLDIGGKNFNVRRGDSTTIPRALETLAKIINNGTSKLAELDISNANLGMPISILLSALVSAPKLKRLNISGNCIEDSGARLLAKVLMTNCCLEKLSLDHNQITLNGFRVIANSLKEYCMFQGQDLPRIAGNFRNTTLTEVELPIFDIYKHIKTDREKAEAVLKEREVVQASEED
ncbi:Leucine Rich Repeat family protein [Trichuris trichiura]|uniref:Leucine Rich Repeat family protein n=1 Tax=Trichuris trichiura TaxID=36087 RepID=A0A077Z8J6_TRITR|nr:Leucine Rich Repeat family protein [Trichuris trichiura]